MRSRRLRDGRADARRTAWLPGGLGVMKDPHVVQAPDDAAFPTGQRSAGRRVGRGGGPAAGPARFGSGPCA